MVKDVSRAYFHVKALRKVYSEISEEDREPGYENMLGPLQYNMYGTRDAALNWHEHYRQHLIDLGFTQGTASPRLFYHPTRGIRKFVHGDDYVSVAHGEELMADGE